MYLVLNGRSFPELYYILNVQHLATKHLSPAPAFTPHSPTHPTSPSPSSSLLTHTLLHGLFSLPTLAFTGTILDQKLVLSCNVEKPLVITTFHLVSPNASLLPNYNLMEPCEYELVRICDDSRPFRIHVDFQSKDLNTGRLGIVFGDVGTAEGSLSRIVVFENLTVGYDRLEEPVVIVVGEEMLFDFNRSQIVVLSSVETVIVDMATFGISVQLTKVPGSESLVVNVTVSEDLVQVCGLCGDLSGQLVFRETGVLADVADPGQVRAFIESWKVPPDMWLLRDQSLECGECN